MTLIGPSPWRTAYDWTGQSIDIRGRTMELLDGRSLTTRDRYPSCDRLSQRRSCVQGRPGVIPHVTGTPRIVCMADEEPFYSPTRKPPAKRVASPGVKQWPVARRQSRVDLRAARRRSRRRGIRCAVARRRGTSRFAPLRDRRSRPRYRPDLQGRSFAGRVDRTDVRGHSRRRSKVGNRQMVCPWQENLALARTVSIQLTLTPLDAPRVGGREPCTIANRDSDHPNPL
jgi:hypothetical protein